MTLWLIMHIIMGPGNFETYLMPDINNAHCDDTLTISADFRHPGPAGGDRVAEQAKHVH